MQQKLFKDFSTVDWAKLHKEENQKQINMKKKKAAMKAPKKRIRLMVECHSNVEKTYLLGVVLKAKKNFKKK